MRDFTLKTYQSLLQALQKAGYRFQTFEEYMTNPELGKVVILRHDVDELAWNALKMAQLENKLGIHATYFFRVVKHSNVPEVIRGIVALGHEVGYHYEDLAAAEGDLDKATVLFEQNLAYFREYYPVKSVSMHGSSTSKYDNRSFWKPHQLADFGLLGEPYLSVDFSKVYYLTDTGYAWDGWKYAIRDKVMNDFGLKFHATQQIVDCVEAGRFPEKALILAHTLWSDNWFQWSFLRVREFLRNRVKLWSKTNPTIAKYYERLVGRYWEKGSSHFSLQDPENAKKRDRIAIFLGHPAHYHMFKFVTAELEQRGIEVDYLVKRKDMLEDLVRESGHQYYLVRKKIRPETGELGLIWALISLECHVIAYIIRRRPRLLVGTYAPVISHLTGVPVIVCCEDDTAVIPRFAKTSYPYADTILSPVYCDGGKWDTKMTKYHGFQKLAYLHPNRFTPSWEIVAPHLRDPNRPYVLIRFAQLKAHHDEGIGGITNQIALQLIRMLSEKFEVYVTSERPLTPELQAYRLHINPLVIHHWLAFATLYIGDSQSMAVEAAMLGTPSIRFSGFAQRIGVLNALENRYHLTVGIPSDQTEKLFETVKEMMKMNDIKEEFQHRRKVMLSEQIEVTDFFTETIMEKYVTLRAK